MQALQEGMVADKWVEEKDSADLEHDVLFKWDSNENYNDDDDDNDEIFISIINRNDNENYNGDDGSMISNVVRCFKLFDEKQCSQ